MDWNKVELRATINSISNYDQILQYRTEQRKNLYILESKLKELNFKVIKTKS